MAPRLLVGDPAEADRVARLIEESESSTSARGDDYGGDVQGRDGSAGQFTGSGIPGKARLDLIVALEALA